MSMFCYQCEQAANGEACVTMGVCAKNAEVAALQDNLIQGLKAVSALAHSARQKGKSDPGIDAFVPYAMFTTLTNTNFDREAFGELISKTEAMRDRAQKLNGGALTRILKSGGDAPQCRANR